MELAPFHSRVNALILGGVATRILGHGSDLKTEALDDSVESVRRGLRRFHPIPRVIIPEDLAKAVAYLASDGSSFVTGHTSPRTAS